MEVQQINIITYASNDSKGTILDTLRNWYDNGFDNETYKGFSYDANSWGAVYYGGGKQDMWSRSNVDVNTVLILTDEWLIFPNGFTKISVYENPKEQIDLQTNTSITLEVNHITGSGYELYNGHGDKFKHIYIFTNIIRI